MKRYRNVKLDTGFEEEEENDDIDMELGISEMDMQEIEPEAEIPVMEEAEELVSVTEE